MGRAASLSSGPTPQCALRVPCACACHACSPAVPDVITCRCQSATHEATLTSWSRGTQAGS